MFNCAFLSISNTEGWFIDDDLVHEPLKNLNWNVQNVPWDQPTDWNSFDLVIIRSPWDYQDHINEFLEVLNQIEKSRAILLNSLDLVKWNINKNYLFELENKGVELAPTLKKSSPTRGDLDSAFQKFNVGEIIIKPIIGANADHTYRIQQNNISDFDRIKPIFHDQECLIQPFMQSVVDEGEFSLIYFGEDLSHTILKTVGAGDYRVQEEHGGGVTPVKEPEAELVTTAEKVMSTLPKPPFYARVDLVRTPQNSFALMELELIEPCLYFRFGKGSAEEFAQCIDKYWRELEPNTL